MIRPLQNRILSAVVAGGALAASGLAPLPAMANGSIAVPDFILSHGVHEREPISETEFFDVEDGKAFAFARIHNTGNPTRVRFVWEIDDETYATIPVKVGASRGWRTWSTVKLRTGNWRVKLVDARGTVLSEKAFTVESRSTGPVVIPADGGRRYESTTGNRKNSAGADAIPALFDFLRR